MLIRAQQAIRTHLMAPTPIHSRFAPTPSGLLHQGNAFNAVLCWLWARHSGGSLRLRIDDLDRPRVRQAYVQDVFDTLERLGIHWDHGPQNAKALATHSQQSRLPRYRETLAALVQTGRVYACTCSRKQIRQAIAERGLPADSPLAYPGTCRDQALPLDTPESSWRLNLEGLPEEAWTDGWLGPVSFSPAGEGDPVIRRRDGGMPAYHLASLTDDLDQGITGILRGEDLLSATVLQRSMARLLKADAFLQAPLVHHPLLLAPDGEKWSKSAGNAVAAAAVGAAAADEAAADGAAAEGSDRPRIDVGSTYQAVADALGLAWKVDMPDAPATDMARSLLQKAQTREQLFPHVPRSATNDPAQPRPGM